MIILVLAVLWMAAVAGMMLVPAAAALLHSSGYAAGMQVGQPADTDTAEETITMTAHTCCLLKIGIGLPGCGAAMSWSGAAGASRHLPGDARRRGGACSNGIIGKGLLPHYPMRRSVIWCQIRAGLCPRTLFRAAARQIGAAAWHCLGPAHESPAASGPAGCPANADVPFSSISPRI